MFTDKMLPAQPSSECEKALRLRAKKRAAFGVGLGVGALTMVGAFVYYYASRVESKAYRLERLKLTVPGGESGERSEKNRRTLKILHISDLHLIEPEHEKIAFLQGVTGREEIDLIFLTGDVFQNESGFKYASKIMSKMPRLGAYAILGNHDYYSYNMINKTIGRIYKPWRTPSVRRDVGAHIEALEFAGFQVLHNDIRRFENEGFSVIGIDYLGIKPELLNALAASVAEEDLLFGLFHVPKKLGMMSDAGIDIAFGGHTHGGQIRIPGVGAVITDSELKRHEASGIIRRDGTVFHVSRGMGADPRSNFRLFCPPAATIIDVEYG